LNENNIPENGNYFHYSNFNRFQKRMEQTHGKGFWVNVKGDEFDYYPFSSENKSFFRTDTETVNHVTFSVKK